MRILIAYSSTHGQTRKIARFAADRLIDAGHCVELLNLEDARDMDLRRFDRVVLAASVHAGRFQRALSEFAAEHADGLQKVPTRLLAISLAAAGHDAEDWKGLDKILSDLMESTGWTPVSVEHVAGAYRPSDYDLFTRFVMRQIQKTKDPDADPQADREYTDWDGLAASIDAWMSGEPV